MIKARNGFSIIEILIVLAAVCLLCIIGWFAYNRITGNKNTANSSQTTNADIQNSKYSPTKNWEDIDLSADDAKRKLDLQNMLFRLVAYEVRTGRYPINAAEASALQDKNPLIDPTTQKAYIVTDSVPGLGAMQYKASATCDAKNRNFVQSKSTKINAFIIRLSEGSFICKSNTQ